MTGKSLGIRTGSYGSLQSYNGGGLQLQATKQSNKQSSITRKPSSKMLLSGSKEKERPLSFVCCRYLGRRRVSMLLLALLALVVFVWGSYTVNKESAGPNVHQHIGRLNSYSNQAPGNREHSTFPVIKKAGSSSTLTHSGVDIGHRLIPPPPSPPLPPPLSHPSPPPPTILASAVAAISSSHHPCENFAFPPPPPPNRRRIGPRPCPVCYMAAEQAKESMPSSPSTFPVLQNLTYVHDENPVKVEPHGGSEFGGYPSLKQRNNSFEIKETMKVHCGFVKGSKPGRATGFDIDEAVRVELEVFHEVIVASAIFGNYDLIQEPQNISEAARKNVPFYMFVDEETEAYIKNTTSYSENDRRVGLWRIVVVHNVPYDDARRNGKVPKLLLHRIFPNVHYSIWIDGKLKLVVDPYQILERFLWRENATFAISRHYRRFDVFEEAEANKAGKKYDNSSIDYQIEFYKKEGLTPYSEAKLPITSDVPEGCVIIREHIPITNLFTCLWFNEVDRFTSRDQLSFSTVRDKIMARVNWSINMFMDCERRNFVVQVYHRDLMMSMAPPIAVAAENSLAVSQGKLTGRNPAGRKIPPKHGRDKRSGSRRHRKVVASNRDNNL